MEFWLEHFGKILEPLQKQTGNMGKSTTMCQEEMFRQVGPGGPGKKHGESQDPSVDDLPLMSHDFPQRPESNGNDEKLMM